VRPRFPEVPLPVTRARTSTALRGLRQRGCQASLLLPSSWFGSTSTACSAAGLRHVAVGAGSGVHEVGPGSTVGARSWLRRTSVVRCRVGSGWTLVFLPSKVRISFGVRTASPRLPFPSCRSSLGRVERSPLSRFVSLRRSGSGSIALPSVRPALPVSRGVRGSSRADVAIRGWCVSARSRPTPPFGGARRSPRRLSSVNESRKLRRGPGGSDDLRLPGFHRPSGSVRVDSPSFLGLATSGCRLWTPDHPSARGENSRSRRPGRLRLLVIAHQGLVRIRAPRLPLPPSQATG